MSENVQSAMLEILKRIQSDVSEVKVRLGTVEKRLDSVEHEVRAHRRETRGTLVIMSSVVGKFDERVTDLEIDVKRIKEVAKLDD